MLGMTMKRWGRLLQDYCMIEMQVIQDANPKLVHLKVNR